MTYMEYLESLLSEHPEHRKITVDYAMSHAPNLSRAEAEKAYDNLTKRIRDTFNAARH